MATCSLVGIATIELVQIFERNATRIASPKPLASGLSGFFVEPGEACPIEDLVTLLNAFGERVGRRKRIPHLKSRHAQMLLCFVLPVEGADLDQPSIVCVRCFWRRSRDVRVYRCIYGFDLGEFNPRPC